MIGEARARFKKALFLDKPREKELDQNNFRRVLIMFYIMVPVHVAQILFFVQALVTDNYTSATPGYAWRLGIIYAHTLTLFIALIVGSIAIIFKNKGLDSSPSSRILTASAALLYLFFGATVCVIDQMVTPSINPYLIASIAVAVVIVLHPYLSIIYYPMVYLFFYFALPLTQGDTDLLATVRVNGISAAAIGLGMSLIVWQTASRSLAQKNMIEKQKEELLEINRQLKEAASTDMLTGLSNRMIFTEFTEKELAKISRTGNKSAMILLDLDGIKSINDHYGHPVGDLVLKTVSKTIKEELRASDTLARFGGDEFAVLLPETTADKAIMIAERVRMAISKLLYPSTGEKFTITASFGVAELSGEKNSTFDSIYREADLALYRAKELGKNRVEG